MTAGVLFDLDGTLADTPQAIATLLTAVLAERGVHPGADAVRATVGLPLEPSLARLLGRPADGPEVAAAAADYQRRFRAHLTATGAALRYPGVATGLRRLAGAGLRLAVATSKPRGAAEKILALMGVADAFAVVAGHDSVEHGKPHPAMARYAADRLGLSAESCVVVGDGVADVGMARAAGMRVIGVSYGAATAAELTAAGAERVVDCFPEVVDLLLAPAPPTDRPEEPR
ncbi:HAD family hydrolase [Kitasatospora sp. NPDC058201]|uniref:HAD family hydrolase n=1 Tax=unclassified Kitasatospora TaxID=2633591 RepID=UPI0036670915